MAHVPPHHGCCCYRSLSACLTLRRRRHGITNRSCGGREAQTVRTTGDTHRFLDLRPTRTRRKKRTRSIGSRSTMEHRRPEQPEEPGGKVAQNTRTEPAARASRRITPLPRSRGLHRMAKACWDTPRQTAHCGCAHAQANRRADGDDQSKPHPRRSKARSITSTE